MRTSRNGVVIVIIQKIGQSAAKSLTVRMIQKEKVQRLNGSWDFKKSLRYSLLLYENIGTFGTRLSSTLDEKQNVKEYCVIILSNYHILIKI